MPPSVPDEDDTLLQDVLLHCVVHPSHMLSLLSDAVPDADDVCWERAASQLWDLSSDPLACRFLLAHGLHALVVTTLDDAMHSSSSASTMPRRVEVCCGILANVASLPDATPTVVVQDDVLAQLVTMLLGGGEGPPWCVDAASLTEVVRLLDAAARLPGCSMAWQALLRAPWLPQCCMWLASNTLRSGFLQRCLQLVATLCLHHHNPQRDAVKGLTTAAAPCVVETLDQAIAARCDATKAQEETDGNAMAALDLVQALLSAASVDPDGVDHGVHGKGLVEACPSLPLQCVQLGLQDRDDVSSNAMQDELARAARAVAAALDDACAVLICDMPGACAALGSLLLLHASAAVQGAKAIHSDSAVVNDVQAVLCLMAQVLSLSGDKKGPWKNTGPWGDEVQLAVSRLAVQGPAQVQPAAAYVDAQLRRQR